jgi:hypothetical protein
MRTLTHRLNRPCGYVGAREIYAILDEGAFVSTAAALVRLADAGRIEQRHDPHRNVKVRRYRSQDQTQCTD